MINSLPNFCGTVVNENVFSSFCLNFGYTLANKGSRFPEGIMDLRSGDLSPWFAENSNNTAKAHQAHQLVLAWPWADSFFLGGGGVGVATTEAGTEAVAATKSSLEDGAGGGLVVGVEIRRIVWCMPGSKIYNLKCMHNECCLQAKDLQPDHDLVAWLWESTSSPIACGWPSGHVIDKTENTNTTLLWDLLKNT